jgi:hypothetical protein
VVSRKNAPPSGRLDPEHLRAFAARRWDLVADEKRTFVANRYRVHGPAANRETALRLRERWVELHPEGPSAEAREDDLAHHVAFKEKLDRAAHGFPRR